MSKKILICDDEEGIRESLKLILGDEFPLILVETGPQCLDCVGRAQENIGLIFMDVKMPQVSGLDLLSEVKKCRPDVPVVMVTGYKSVEAAADATRRGASGYIVKPFKSDEILNTAKKFVK